LISAKEPSRASSGEEARRGEAREGAAREARGGGESRDQLRARRGRRERRSERRRKERSEGAKEGGESEAASPEASGESMEKSESKERSGEGGLSDLLPGERAKSRERIGERREGRRAKRSGEHGEKSEGEKGGSRLPSALTIKSRGSRGGSLSEILIKLYKGRREGLRIWPPLWRALPREGSPDSRLNQRI
jgi:hypothetical protein